MFEMKFPSWKWCFKREFLYANIYFKKTASRSGVVGGRRGRGVWGFVGESWYTWHLKFPKHLTDTNVLLINQTLGKYWTWKKICFPQDATQQQHHRKITHKTQDFIFFSHAKKNLSGDHDEAKTKNYFRSMFVWWFFKVLIVFESNQKFSIIFSWKYGKRDKIFSCKIQKKMGNEKNGSIIIISETMAEISLLVCAGKNFFLQGLNYYSALSALKRL